MEAASAAFSIGLGLGLSARDILQLYEEKGRAIFDQEHGSERA
jgi:hypothetical protein